MSRALYDDPSVTSKVNLVGIDLLGHGRTEGPSAWSYWSVSKHSAPIVSNSFAPHPRTNAQMALDVVKALGIKKVYALGTSQGGFIGEQIAAIWCSLSIDSCLFANSP
jgi:pimeloyl-ACP methyl ester carboxylesterase